MGGGSNAGRGSPVSDERVLTGEEIHERLQRASIAARLIPRTKAGNIDVCSAVRPSAPSGQTQMVTLIYFLCPPHQGEAYAMLKASCRI